MKTRPLNDSPILFVLCVELVSSFDLSKMIRRLWPKSFVGERGRFGLGSRGIRSCETNFRSRSRHDPMNPMLHLIPTLTTSRANWGACYGIVEGSEGVWEQFTRRAEASWLWRYLNSKFGFLLEMSLDRCYRRLS